MIEIPGNKRRIWRLLTRDNQPEYNARCERCFQGVETAGCNPSTTANDVEGNERAARARVQISRKLNVSCCSSSSALGIAHSNRHSSDGSCGACTGIASRRQSPYENRIAASAVV
jgi:hypothetical protein